MSRVPSPQDDATRDAQAGAEQGEKSKQPDSRRTKHIVAGAAIGIGSAALVAALLYANRARNRSKA